MYSSRTIPSQIVMQHDVLEKNCNSEPLLSLLPRLNKESGASKNLPRLKELFPMGKEFAREEAISLLDEDLRRGDDADEKLIKREDLKGHTLDDIWKKVTQVLLLYSTF